MSTSRFVSTTAAALLAAAVLAPAQASAARAFNLRTDVGRNKGSAHSFGPVDFSQQGRRVQIKGWINDICPGDGYGAHLSIRVLRKDRPYSGLADVSDERGCTAGDDFFQFTRTYDTKISSVTFQLVELRDEIQLGDQDWATIYR